MALSTLPAAPGRGFQGINPAQCTEDAEPAEGDFQGDPAPIRPAFKLFGNYSTLQPPSRPGWGGMEESLPGGPSTGVLTPESSLFSIAHQEDPLTTLKGLMQPSLLSA